MKRVGPLQLYALSLLVCRLCALCAPSVQRCVAMFCAPAQTEAVLCMQCSLCPNVCESVCTISVLCTLDSCSVPCVTRKCAILCAPTMLCAPPRCSWAPGTSWSRLYSCCSSLVGAHSSIAGSAPCRVCCLHPHCHSTNTSQPSLHCSQ